MSDQALKNEIVTALMELDPGDSGSLAGFKINTMIEVVQILRRNDQNRAGARRLADEIAATPIKQEDSAATNGNGNKVFPNNDGPASDSSSRTLEENMDDDLKSVTSGELLFTGTARLGSGKFVT